MDLSARLFQGISDTTLGFRVKVNVFFLERR